MPIDPLLREAIALFAVEAAERVEVVGKCVLELENVAPAKPEGEAATKAAWTRLARELHTLKGTAATSGLSDLAAVAHDMETAVAPHQKKGGALPAVVADALLAAADAFVARVKAYASEHDDAQPFPTAIRDALKAAAAPSSSGAGAAPEGAEPRSRRARATAPTVPVAPAGSVEQPPLPEPASKGEPEGEPEGELEPADSSPGTPPSSRSSRSVPSAPALPAAAAAPGADGDDDGGAWRVRSEDVLAFSRDVERLRELRLRLDERLRELDAAVRDAGLAAREHLQLRARLAGVRRGLAQDGEEAADVVAALEDGVKAICTLPVRTILDPLHRVVRDLCRASGKRAALALVGGDIALDRRLLESLKGPLIQLVRNAVDHGVEAPAERRARGKHDVAAVVVRAEQQGNLLFLEVADDGAGLKTDAILAEATRLGIVDQAAAAAGKLTPAEIQRLIFHQGLSTKAAAVSETSGRGVGLDLVAGEVRALHGSIDVQSVRGQGTRFLLHVPVQLGSSPILIVRVGDQQLGVPMLSVEATVAARAERIRIGRASASLEHRDQLLPLQDLGALLGLRPTLPPEAGAPVLVFAARDKRVALVVDEIMGDRDLVVRPLPEELDHLPAYQGVAVMAKGDLVLVLRPDWLGAQEQRVPSAAGRRVLVVDDSLTARALHRTILEAGGYQVHAAASVEAGEEQLRRSTYDVIVSDLGFAPGMRDGMSFLTAVRAAGKTRNAVFVLVSMNADQDVKARALALGADAVLTKEECAAGRLLAEVSTLLSRGRSA